MSAPLESLSLLSLIQDVPDPAMRKRIVRAFLMGANLGNGYHSRICLPGVGFVPFEQYESELGTAVLGKAGW